MAKIIVSNPKAINFLSDKRGVKKKLNKELDKHLSKLPEKSRVSFSGVLIGITSS